MGASAVACWRCLACAVACSSGSRLRSSPPAITVRTICPSQSGVASDPHNMGEQSTPYICKLL